jgi:isopentenyl-diphosphate delta-isomerase
MKKVKVILVDDEDNPIGLMGKMEAHRKGLLHRAISVFIINSAGEWILQKRAHDKYHSKGLWTNACCTHPLPGESELVSANRRLSEEMGIVSNLKKVFTFIYKEEVDNNLTEHEYDHVFAGISDIDPEINTIEVVEWKKTSFEELHLDILNNPDNYTTWFKKIYQNVNDHLLMFPEFRTVR